MKNLNSIHKNKISAVIESNNIREMRINIVYCHFRYYPQSFGLKSSSDRDAIFSLFLCLIEQNIHYTQEIVRFVLFTLTLIEKMYEIHQIFKYFLVCSCCYCHHFMSKSISDIKHIKHNWTKLKCSFHDSWLWIEIDFEWLKTFFCSLHSLNSPLRRVISFTLSGF